MRIFFQTAAGNKVVRVKVLLLKKLTSAGLIFALLTSLGFASDRYHGQRQTAQDDYWHYHSVGNIGLTVTNFGILGQGYQDPDQPSCLYSLRSNLPQEQVEHFSYGGIWVGGVKRGQVYTSTGIYDGVMVLFEDRGREFTASAQEQIRWNPVFHHVNKIDRRYDFSRLAEDSIVVFGGALNGHIEDGYLNFNSANWDTIITQSSIRDASLNNPYADYAQFFSPNAISHQDLLCAFTDTNLVVPGTEIVINDHQPLGIHVNQETYSWYEPFADAFTIFNYTITNIPEGWDFADQDTVIVYDTGLEVEYAAGDTIWRGAVIEEPYFGIWLDTSVGNMIYTPTSDYDPNGGPGGRWNWYDNLNVFDQEMRMGISYDFDGDAGWAQSYLGAKILGADPYTDTWRTNYHQWTWTGSTYGDRFPMPDAGSDQARYETMGQAGRNPSPVSADSIQSWMMFMSCGPFPDLAPGQRFNVAMALVCGQWNGAGDDGPERRENLYRNAEWAQIAYNGEDRNENGILDPGEDLDGDGEITRYILPSAPPSPQLVVVPEDRRVHLFWNDLPEFAVDPISNNMDFEGYRIYGSPKTEGLLEEWTLLSDYDVDYIIDSTDTATIGYNTGLQGQHLEVLNPPLIIQGVSVKYHWVNDGVLNGWPRELYYAVTAYDRGDPANNLPSLESPRNANRVYAFPGSTPAEEGDDRVGVYPNPYYGRAEWDGATGRDRLIWFRNLPPDCQITIFTLAGERVDSFHHNAVTYNGDDVERISTGASPGERRVFAGGEHAWDLLTENDQEIASGLYIYTIEDTRNGDVKTGRFLIIK